MNKNLPNDPKRHHFIPQTYLRHFQNSNKQIYRSKIWDSIKVSIKETSASGIAYEDNFYRLLKTSYPDISPLLIENHLNRQYEEVIPAFWEAFSSHQSYIGINRKYEMVEVMTHLTMRNPYIRDKFFENKDFFDSRYYQVVYREFKE